MWGRDVMRLRQQRCEVLIEARRGLCSDEGMEELRQRTIVASDLQRVKVANVKMIDSFSFLLRLSEFGRILSILHLFKRFAVAQLQCVCPLQTDPFLFLLIHSHNVLLSSNKF